jgi:hypothetical protein
MVSGWERQIPTSSPVYLSVSNASENGTIHCRVINKECGYGAADHLYFGKRNDILSLMSYWKYVGIEFFDEVKKDKMCIQGCFGNECILQAWISHCGIKWVSDMKTLDGSAPGSPYLLLT